MWRWSGRYSNKRLHIDITEKGTNKGRMSNEVTASSGEEGKRGKNSLCPFLSTTIEERKRENGCKWVLLLSWMNLRFHIQIKEQQTNHCFYTGESIEIRVRGKDNGNKIMLWLSFHRNVQGLQSPYCYVWEVFLHLACSHTLLVLQLFRLISQVHSSSSCSSPFITVVAFGHHTTAIWSPTRYWSPLLFVV